MNTDEELVISKNGLITTIAIGIDGKVQYALEGSVFVGGAVVQWLRDELRFINHAKDTEYFASQVDDTNGVYVVPAFTGIGAPYWDMYARGAIVGLTRGSNRNHIIRAALESIAYQSKDLMDAMREDVGYEIEEIKVDGGACKNEFLMNFQSDISNADVIRPKNVETTALGAAYLAGLAVGFWSSRDELVKEQKVDKVFKPEMDKDTIYRLHKGWKKAVSRSLDWEEE